MDLVRHQPLLDAARAGDVSAIERLLAVCQPDIRRYAQRNCLISDVDDAVQESLLVLFAARGGGVLQLAVRHRAPRVSSHGAQGAFDRPVG